MTIRLQITATVAAVAIAIAAIGAGTLAETQASATSAEQACDLAAWPYVPAHCLRSHAPEVDRLVTADRARGPYLMGVDAAVTARLNAR